MITNIPDEREFHAVHPSTALTNEQNLRIKNTKYLESFRDWKSEVNVLGPKAEWQQSRLFAVVSGNVYFQAFQTSEAHHICTGSISLQPLLLRSDLLLLTSKFLSLSYVSCCD